MLKAAVSRPRARDTLTLSVARFLVECECEVAGIEALVFSDGAVTLPARKFRALVNSYTGTRFLTAS